MQLLIERENQLELLHSLAESANSGCIALVSGEAGIGKTTLLQAFRDSLKHNESHVKWGACDPLDTPRVLGPIHDMRAEFGSDVQELIGNDSSFAQLSSAILTELENMATPVVMVFEDAHWADNATLDLLKCIGRRIGFLNTLLVISYRRDEVGSRHPLTQVLGDFPQTKTHRLELPPISPEGVKKMAELSGHSENGLHEITGGNPFFLTELLASSDSSSERVPESVLDAINSRLNRLSESTQEFLENISVIPYAIEPVLLAKWMGYETESLAEECVTRHLLRYTNNGALRFRHELARLGTLQRNSLGTQKKIHRQILTILLNERKDDHLDQIVCHALGCKSAPDVLKFAPQIAQSASINGAHQEAAAHLAAALQYADEAPPEQAATLYESWSYEAALVQIDDETIAARHKALALWRELHRPDKIGENLRWISRLHWYRGESKEAAKYLDESIEVLENTQPSAERAMAYSLKSQFHMLNDRMDEAIHWGKKALKTESDYPSVEVRIHASNNIGSALLALDNLDGLDYMQSSLSLSLEHDLHEHAARVYTNLADYAVGRRNFELAETTIADGIVFDTNHDLDSWTHYLIGLLAELRMEQGRFEEAETIAQGVEDLDNQTLLMKLPSLLVLSKCHLRLGRKGADTLLNQALENALSTGELQYILPARLGLIEAAWINGTHDVALEQIDHIMSSGSLPQDAWLNAELSLWMHRLDWGGKINTDADASFPLPFQLEIEGNHKMAADAWNAMGVPYQAAITLLHCNNEHKLDYFMEALTLLESMYANGTIRKLKDLANAAGLSDQLPLTRRGPRKTSRQHPLGLTKKEQEIAPMVMLGLSNKDISTKISRSTRTVENHVSSILKKLNVSNRMEAMLRFKNEPWLVNDVDNVCHREM